MKYYLRILSGMRFKKLKAVIDQIHEKTNKNKVLLFFDIIQCGFRYGAGYNDYNIFGYYNMNHKQRTTFVNRVKNKKIIEICNNPDYNYIFNHKSNFDTTFKKYLHREFLVVKDMDLKQFKKFMKNKDVIFAKPDVGESGKGIERLEKKNYKTEEEMFNYVKEKNFGVVEELIKQHKDLNKVYPLAINSLRVVTLVANGEADVVYITAKFGNEGKFVDNMENSGLACPVNMKTHKIEGVGHTSPLIPYEKHPYTNIKFIGYKIPYIDEVIELVKKAALEVKEIRYIGWDVFIGEDGPGIIEGNNYPGYDFWQLPEHTPDKIGLMPYYEAKLPQLKKKSKLPLNR